jgi:hypothetical protein
MIVVRLLPVIISALLISAHILRFHGLTATILCLSLLITLCFRNPWTLRMWQIFLSIAALIWVWTTVNLVHLRVELGLPWVRLAIILISVIVFTLFTVIWLETKSLKAFYRHRD